MKKKCLLLLLVFQLGVVTLLAQQQATGFNIAYEKNMPQEKLFVHFNSSLLFVGEYCYYAMYLLRTDTNALSEISKIGYLELVNENKETVFKHKVRIEKGRGYSSFFIPSDLPSGNYKLLAYTHWMLNQGTDYFFQDDVTIINPYTSNQSVFLKDKATDSIPIIRESSLTAANTSTISPLVLEINDAEYAVREQVSLKIKTERGQSGSGNYSISVRKKEALPNASKSTAEDFKKVYPSSELREVSILPELRGELLAGKVVSQNKNRSLENDVVGVSFPGEDYLFKVGTTDKEGKFYINIPEEYDTSEAYLQLLSPQDSQDSITLLPATALDLAPLEFNKFELKPEMEQLIKDRSVHIQIENAYYSSKPDTILLKQQNNLFYNAATTPYVLDEYTRFPTVKETFVEVVEHVWLSKNTQGQLEFHVRPIAPYIESGKLPLVFIDGFLVLDHDWIMNLPANQIETIRISRNIHFYGTHVFQGIVDIYTFEGDYYKNYYSDRITNVTLFKPDERKNYYRQSYMDDLKTTQARLPDFRYQLLWLPNYSFKEGEEEVAFFTSDVVGEYEIVIEGFTDLGRPISLHKTFWVK